MEDFYDGIIFLFSLMSLEVTFHFLEGREHELFSQGSKVKLG